jgi:hypothetical protein
MSKCIDNIVPPIYPEIVECVNASKDKTFVVVRVPQSKDAPHAIAKNTKVYIRTGRQNDPEELASLDRVAWITEKRRKAEEFGEWLFVRADARFELLRQGRVPGFDSSRDPENDRCLLTLAISPVYPDASPLVRAPQLDSIHHRIAVPDPMGTSNQFPVNDDRRARLVEDGVIIHVPGGDGLRTYHTHLNIHGLYFYKQSMLWHPPLRNGVTTVHPPAMRITEIVDRTYCLLASAKKYYGFVGYIGPLSVRLKLENFMGTPLLVADLATQNPEYQLHYSADPLIQALVFTTTHSMIAESNDIASRLVQRVAWAFDWDVSSTMLEGYSRDRFRWLQ